MIRKDKDNRLQELKEQLAEKKEKINIASKSNESKRLISELLLELATIVFNTAPLESSEANSLIDVLEKYADSNSKQTKYCLPVLGNIANGAKLPILQRISLILKCVLLESNVHLNIAAAFKSFAFLVNENAKLANENIAMIIPILSRSIFLDEQLLSLESETEWSDSLESSKQRVSKLKPEWKVQYQALFCLEALASQCSKQLYPHLTKFITADIRNHNSLLYIIQYHKSDQVRSIACKALVAIFTDSKQYLSIAVHNQKNSSFTSLSQQIANQLLAILDALSNSLQSTTRIAILPELCSALNSILLNANLQNLNSNLDVKILQLLLDILVDASSKNATHFILDCLSSLMDQVNEQYTLLHSSALQAVLSLTLRPESAVKISILSVVASISSSNPNIIRENWNDSVLPLVSMGVESSIHAINLASLKVLEHFAHSSNVAGIVLDESWWTSVFEMTAPLWMLPVYNIRCLSCNLISQVTKPVFHCLESRLTSLLITSILAFTQDEHVDVRAAACGALGVIIGFHCNSGNDLIHDAAVRLQVLCDDKSLKVRIRAFWALGALADAIRCDDTLDESISSPDSTPEPLALRLVSLDLEDSLLLSILQILIAGCSDHEKVRYHAFRALGRLAPAIPPHIMHQSLPLLNKAVLNLIANLSTGAFKTRWNACHCIRNLIASDGFPLGRIAPYSEALWLALVQVAISSTNFKVKTGALLALSTPTSPSRYATSNSSSSEIIQGIVSGMKDIVNSTISGHTTKSSEEQGHTAIFIENIFTSLIHIKSCAFKGNLWSAGMEISCNETLTLIASIAKTAPIKSSFDPKGL